jgi:hypothetical protein
MRYRATFLAGLAAGFVVGTRAGRERYEQMKKVARRAADSPAFQQAAGAAAAQATGLAKTARDKVTDKVAQRSPRLAAMARRTSAVKLPGLAGQNGDSAEAARQRTTVPAPTGPLDGS